MPLMPDESAVHLAKVQLIQLILSLLPLPWRWGPRRRCGLGWVSVCRWGAPTQFTSGQLSKKVRLPCQILTLGHSNSKHWGFSDLARPEAPALLRGDGHADRWGRKVEGGWRGSKEEEGVWQPRCVKMDPGRQIFIPELELCRFGSEA